MQKTIAGLAAIAAVAFAGPALAQSETDRIQETEQPGSELEFNLDSDGAVEFGRKGTLDAQDGVFGPPESDPLQLGGPLGERGLPLGPNEIDAELPGEGPESLSGPDDDDPLPY
jgi:hypothetical protein